MVSSCSFPVYTTGFLLNGVQLKKKKKNQANLLMNQIWDVRGRRKKKEDSAIWSLSSWQNGEHGFLNEESSAKSKFEEKLKSSAWSHQCLPRTPVEMPSDLDVQVQGCQETAVPGALSLAYK